MKTILKYEVKLGLRGDREETLHPWRINTYRGAKLLDVQMNFGQPVMWMEVDTDEMKEPKYFRIFATGEPMPTAEGLVMEHRATLQINRGEWVWHLYEIKRGLQQM